MKKFKFKILLFLGTILFSLLLFSAKSNAASYATYFYGEPIVIEKGEEIEILSNEISIDIKNSSIKNIFLLKNNLNNDVTSKISIKLENDMLSTSINNLKILVNKLEIKNISKEDGMFIFNVKIPKNEGKKIEISYKTDNELRNAKIIKYTLDNLKGKKLKHFKISINLPETDVPLVTGIYPECYSFDNNTVITEYYNFNVNSLTKDFIIEKQTYKNLLYGQENELSDVEKKVLEKAETWITKGLGEGKYKYEPAKVEDIEEDENTTITISSILAKELNIKEDDVWKNLYNDDDDYIARKRDKEIQSIICYSVAKLCERENIGNSTIIPYTSREDYAYPLTADYIEKVKKNTCPLYGLTLAVDYVRSEGDKELYVYKHISGYENTSKYDYVKLSEWNILKTKNRRMWYDSQERRGLKIIHINQDITGAEIDATDEEKIEYVNMINPSLYARVTIYDGNVKEKENDDGYAKIKLPTGYYGNENLIIAKKYNINSNYDDEEYEMNSIYIDYDNEIVANKCKVPNLAHNVGYREYIDGKYVISFFNTAYHSDGYGNIKNAANCDRAKALKQENEARITQVKNQINNEITNLVINDNIKEDEKISNDKIIQNNASNSQTNSKLKKDIVVYGICFGGIIILIIIIVVLLIKRGKK